MSMRDYAVQDYGLVINKETIKAIAEKMFMSDYEDAPNPKVAFNADFAEDPYAFICEVEDALRLCSFSEFTGEAFKLKDDGEVNWLETISYSNSNIYYLPIENQPSLFKAAYASVDEIVDEFKRKMSFYLPEDFDYRNNICMISGTYFG